MRSLPRQGGIDGTGSVSSPRYLRHFGSGPANSCSDSGSHGPLRRGACGWPHSSGARRAFRVFRSACRPGGDGIDPWAQCRAPLGRHDHACCRVLRIEPQFPGSRTWRGGAGLAERCKTRVLGVALRHRSSALAVSSSGLVLADSGAVCGARRHGVAFCHMVSDADLHGCKRNGFHCLSRARRHGCP